MPYVCKAPNLSCNVVLAIVVKHEIVSGLKVCSRHCSGRLFDAPRALWLTSQNIWHVLYDLQASLMCYIAVVAASGATHIRVLSCHLSTFVRTSRLVQVPMRQDFM
jgi:hypothetical protein